MSEQPWTIDAIAHAIPIPELRQNFLREAHLVAVDELPDVCAKWARLVERYEASRPEMEALLEYAKSHNGELPDEYRETPESRTAWDQWEQSMRQHQGHSAA